jgi:Putative zinc-finger
MLRKNPDLSMRHISDEELVRSADGELSSERAAEVDAHLEACWGCRVRMEDIQSTITGLFRAYHAEFDFQVPSIAGPRALLGARLTQLGSEQPVEWWKRILQFTLASPGVGVVGLTLIAIAIGILWFRHGSFDAGASPNRSLTPGATRQVTISEVCSVPQEQVVGDVSVSLRQKVLQEYGITNARLEDYEIDYLIAPRLGGTEDIRNLWPEPYRDQVWNARVKDALEERLHEMVCSGQLDLSTAQHDIATDWIAAYKKYFHTNAPLARSL